MASQVSRLCSIVSPFDSDDTLTDRKGELMRHRIAVALAILAVLLAGALFGRVQFGQLAHPLMWHDEALTAVFGERVLDYGYPKVHGKDGEPHYPMHHDLSVGTKEGSDAYIGSPWLQYYFAAAGVAWAERTEDLYAKTFRLRLPFALAGCAGLAILLMTGLSAIRGSLRKLSFALLYLLALSYSVLLVLHLREVRYYALTVLLVASAVSLAACYTVFRKLSAPAYAVALALVCILLFNSFYLAFVGLAIGLGLHACIGSLRAASETREDASLTSWLIPHLAPLVLAAIAVLPLLAFYEVFDVAAAFSERYSGPKNAYAYKLIGLVKGLLRYEFLAPALACHAAAFVSLQRASNEAIEATAKRRQLTRMLAVVIVCYGATVALAPFYYERYSIALSPVITMLMLLDGFTLLDLQRDQRRAPAAIAITTACAVCLAATLVVRLPDFTARLAEVSTPIEGPLDHAVAYLKTAYPRPDELVIATNYEDPSLRFYLGSRVIVGWFNPDVERDLDATPDIIIPRPGNRHLEELATLAARGSFEQKRFPIQNVHANNVPSLAPWNHARWVHRFSTPAAESDSPDAFFLLERSPAEIAPGEQGLKY